MRIRISHTIAYTYAEPVRQLTQHLRLTPRDHDGQHVMSWRIEPDIDGRLRAGADPFGNVVHDFAADGPITALSIRVSGIVETIDLAGIVRGADERVPPEVFMRETLLSRADDAIRDFAAARRASADSDLGGLHALMDGLGAAMTCDGDRARLGIGAVAAFAARGGIAQDIAHVFIAGARHLGVPARYVSGYVASGAGLPHADGAHAWAEAFLPDFGWIGFDPANGLCPIETHVRIATGLDFSDAAPIRGAQKGGSGETMAIRMSAAGTGQ